MKVDEWSTKSHETARGSAEGETWKRGNRMLQKAEAGHLLGTLRIQPSLVGKWSPNRELECERPCSGRSASESPATLGGDEGRSPARDRGAHRREHKHVIAIFCETAEIQLNEVETKYDEVVEKVEVVPINARRLPLRPISDASPPTRIEEKRVASPIEDTEMVETGGSN
jgi:hypothetical protein